MAKAPTRKQNLSRTHSWAQFQVRGSRVGPSAVTRLATATPETKALASKIDQDLIKLSELLKERKYPNG